MPGCALADGLLPLAPLRLGERLRWLSSGDMIPAPPIGISPEVGV